MTESPVSGPLTGWAAVVTGAARGIGRAAAVEDLWKTGELVVAAIELLKKKTPLGVPWLEPEDVAPLVVFLASDQAGMVSGTSFAITGGDSAHVTA